MGHLTIVSYPAHGHVNPTLPVVGELVRRGHPGSYVVAAQCAAAARAPGATVLAYPSPVPKSWDAIAIPEHITADVVAEAALLEAMEGLAPLDLVHRALVDDRPDAFLYDA